MSQHDQDLLNAARTSREHAASQITRENDLRALHAPMEIIQRVGEDAAFSLSVASELERAAAI